MAERMVSLLVDQTVAVTADPWVDERAALSVETKDLMGMKWEYLRAVQ